MNDSSPALTLDGFADRVRRHTNDDHQHELCHFVAAYAGIPIDEIGGVELTELNRDGAEFWWIDSSGARTVRVEFAPPAHTIEQLGLALRSALQAGQPAA